MCIYLIGIVKLAHNRNKVNVPGFLNSFLDQGIMSSPKTFDYQKAQLENWDFVVLAVYFISVLCVGIWVSIFYFILEMPLKTNDIMNCFANTFFILQICHAKNFKMRILFRCPYKVFIKMLENGFSITKLVKLVTA